MADTSYTNSLKFYPTHPPGSDEWNLRVTNPGLADTGAYECQAAALTLRAGRAGTSFSDATPPPV